MTYSVIQLLKTFSGTKTHNPAACSKCSSSKAAADESTGGVASGLR